MDPFDARLQYIQLIETLNPSALAMSKAVQFALKNSELHEDFHSCILEVLDKVDLNSKINVLYYIQELVIVILQTFKQETKPYLRNFEANFKVILSKLLPNDNLINLRDCVDVLINIEKLYEINNDKLRLIYTNLNLINCDDKIDEDLLTNGFAEGWKFLIEKKSKGFKNRLKLLNGEEISEPINTSFSRERILARIETDRERHKKIKEGSWAITRNVSNSNVLKNLIADQLEFDKLWNQHDELSEEDYQELKELNDIAKQSYNY